MTIQEKKYHSLLSKYRGQIILTCISVFFLALTPLFTYTIRVVLQVILTIVLIAMFAVLYRYDDQLRRTPVPDGVKCDTPEERKRKGRLLWVTLLLLIAVCLFCPGIPVWGYAVLAGLIVLTILHIRLNCLAKTAPQKQQT